MVVNKRNRLEKRIEKKQNGALKKQVGVEKNDVLFFGASLKTTNKFLNSLRHLFEKVRLVNDADADEICFDKEVISKSEA